MLQDDQHKERWLPAALALATFVAGMALALALHAQRAADLRHERARGREEAARTYAMLVQRQLDAYVGKGLSLAAHLSTSHAIDNASLTAYVRAARDFEGLKGLHAYGYLPRVAPALADALERDVQADLPGYRIRERRPGADYYYPLLFVADCDPQRAAAVRGLDYSAYPERFAAIRKAEATGAPAATAVHASIGDAARTPVVLLFTPAWSPERRFDGGTGAGVVFAVMRVAELFEGIDDGKLTRTFALVVHEPDETPDRLVYASEPGAFRPGGVDRTRLVHAATLRLADRSWRMEILSRPEADAQAGGDWPFVAAVLLASLGMAYVVYLHARQRLARRRHTRFARGFEALLDAHPFAVYAADRSGRFVFVNRRLRDELDLAPDALAGQPFTLFMRPASVAPAQAAFAQALQGRALAFEATARARGDLDAILAIVLVPVAGADGVDFVLGFAENVTERQRVERDLYESRQMLRLILDTIPDRVFWKDRAARYLGANRHMAQAAGVADAAQLVGLTDADMPWAAAAAPYRDEDRQIMETGTPLLNMQRSQRTHDGAVRWFDVSKLPLTDDAGRIVGLLGVARDITQYKDLERELVERANHDSLTGLPNRAFFTAQLAQAIARAGRRRTGLALMYFDIDHFQRINDGYGHDSGDAVIRAFAARVRAQLRAADFVARLGGDEFVLIVDDMQDATVPEHLAAKLVASMAAPLHAGHHALAVTTSIGVALFAPGMTPDALLKAADDAMYAAKRAGRNGYRVYGRQ